MWRAESCCSGISGLKYENMRKYAKMCENMRKRAWGRHGARMRAKARLGEIVAEGSYENIGKVNRAQ